MDHKLHTLRESLLTPSLSTRGAPSTALYSVQSGFLVAFFGGSYATILYSALNSWKLKRPLDALAYIAAFALVTALLAAAIGGWKPLMALFDMLGRGSTSYLFRGVSLLLFGAFYLLHRSQHRSATLFGLASLSPWIPAIACAALGYGLQRLVVEVLLKVLA